MNFKVPFSYDFAFEDKLDDVNGLGILLFHKKTGARVALIANEDDNKVFSVGFRTPPKNSTGVAHIIEHSVLCGSKHFPAKDPFVELAKGSLNTFLNAMTYSDRTVYPVASQNTQDFKNLMHVYLDAVFFPNIYERKEIFQQEGWHYELENEADDLKYNGVVYNEMKGAFSSPEQMLFRMNLNSLFPDTAYGVESGGDPDFIPELSYEEFLDFHKTYYHPSNSYIYLYGDMDFEERLQWLDQEYLGKFDRLEVNSAITLQKGFDVMKEIVAYYPLGEGEDVAENTYLSYNTVIGTTMSKELNLSFMILDYVLLDAPGAPVKQALLDAQMGKDILSSYLSEYLQPTLSIVAKNSDEDKKEQFLTTIRQALTKVAEEGVDEKSLRAAINYYEFKYREADYGAFPKGLMYGLRVMGIWLYDDNNPFQSLKDTVLYDRLKEKIGTGYYEQLIRDYLLNNTHSTMIVLKPKAGLNTEREEAVKNKLSAYKAGLSKEEIDNIIEETRKLREFQEKPSTKEELEAIPLLAREDIGKEVQPLYNTELKVEDVKVIHHNVFTNEIAYLRLLFDVSDIPKDLLPYMSLLSLILGYVNTENYSYLELSNEINIHTGGISTDVKSFAIKGSDQYLPVFEFSTKVLYHKLPEAFRLMEEMLYRTYFDDTKRLKEIVDEMKSRMQMRFNSSGHSVAVDRAMSYYSAHGLFKEITTGITFYKFLEELVVKFDEKKGEAVSKLKELMKIIFRKDKLLVSITADEEGIRLLKKQFPAFIIGLKDREDKAYEEYDRQEMVPTCHNEGFKTAMQVQYVARAGNFLKAGYQYTGALKVLKIILSYDYLWNNVRVKGGAYGCMCNFSGVDGDAYFTSYRDPNLKETNQIYEKCHEFVANYDADERDITKNIIGTISSLDTPLTPQSKGKRSLSMYLAGITMEDLQRERDEILKVSIKDIRALSGIVKSITDAGYICVIGNEKKIEENKELFKEVKKLLK
ncbi:insulinase family protein [Mobilitalea sibirica]|uniref:Insulinase family protein n=1 Tax=Mobilitalea sibirica TaxID=1462919 RepID=A0A8J7HBP5_9FIRM|nr:insulinase family protein [Mobilitalea sibirica]MBH1939454.1 insulinase family protein [Mobilitalea sibirica]